MNTTSHSLPARFARALGTLASGVPNPWDESDDYFRPFYVELPSVAVLDDATLRAALKVSSRYRLDVASINLDEVAGEAEGELAASYHLLGTVMNATLTEIQRINARAPRGGARATVARWTVPITLAGWTADDQYRDLT